MSSQDFGQNIGHSYFSDDSKRHLYVKMRICEFFPRSIRCKSTFGETELSILVLILEGAEVEEGIPL